MKRSQADRSNGPQVRFYSSSLMRRFRPDIIYDLVVATATALSVIIVALFIGLAVRPILLVASVIVAFQISNSVSRSILVTADQIRICRGWAFKDTTLKLAQFDTLVLLERPLRYSLALKGAGDTLVHLSLGRGLGRSDHDVRSELARHISRARAINRDGTGRYLD